MKDDALLQEWTSQYRPNSARGMLVDVVQFRNNVKKRWDRITTGDIAQYMQGLADMGMRPGMLRRTVTSLHSVFRFLANQNVIKTDVAAAYKNRWPEDESARRVKRLTPKQVRDIFENCSNYREYLCVALSYGSLTALEITNLRWRDVALHTGVITIPTATVHGHRRQRRSIQLPAETMTMFRNYHSPLNVKPSDPVFQSRRRGGRLSPRQLTRIVAQVGERCDIVVNTSLLRNSHAVHAIERGASLSDVQTRMGLTIRGASRFFSVLTDPSSRPASAMSRGRLVVSYETHCAGCGKVERGLGQTQAEAQEILNRLGWTHRGLWRCSKCGVGG